MGFYHLVEGAATVFCDSQNAIQLSKNNVYHGRSKHIDIKYFFWREASESGDIEVKYLESENIVHAGNSPVFKMSAGARRTFMKEGGKFRTRASDGC